MILQEIIMMILQAMIIKILQEMIMILQDMIIMILQEIKPKSYRANSEEEAALLKSSAPEM